MAELFRETFCFLPLAHCLNRRVLVLHGGLFSRDGVTLDDIARTDRNRYVPSLHTHFVYDSQIMLDTPGSHVLQPGPYQHVIVQAPEQRKL